MGAWDDLVMSEGDPGPDSFEAKLRAAAREFSESLERFAGRLDPDEIADRIGESGERVKHLAELAGDWLNGQGQNRDAAAGPSPADERPGLGGPHPLDMPTEEQGLALSALDSGRWRVESGTNELISGDDGPPPRERVGIVSELRARDWIAAGGEVTLLGRDALRRWADSTSQG
jgi:hypothetical protein